MRRITDYGDRGQKIYKYELDENEAIRLKVLAQMILRTSEQALDGRDVNNEAAGAFREIFMDAARMVSTLSRIDDI